MMELSLPCAQAMGTTQSKVCLDGASGKHSGYDQWTQCRPFLESRWKAIPSRKMQLACSFPSFPSFHIISYHFPHPQHPGHCKTASSVETRSLRSKLTGASVAVRHCNYHDMFMVMIILYHAWKKFENLKFSCLGEEFIIDGLRFFSRDASLRRLYSHGGWERFDSCWLGTLWMAEVGDSSRGLLGYEITSIILNHLRLKRMRSWWLWMFCEWFPLQLHFRYRRVRLPSVRDASLTDGLANGANEMEGMLGGPEGRCQTEQGSLPSSQGNSRKSNVLGSKQRASQRVSLF